MKIKKIHEEYEISESGVSIVVFISEKHLHIRPPLSEGELYDSPAKFMFASSNSPETLQKWEKVAKLINRASGLLKQKRLLRYNGSR